VASGVSLAAVAVVVAVVTPGLGFREWRAHGLECPRAPRAAPLIKAARPSRPTPCLNRVGGGVGVLLELLPPKPTLGGSAVRGELPPQTDPEEESS
jgi:hypothetical protein